MGLVERIKALCSKRGITLNQMEKELGLKGTVARWQEHEPSVGKVRLVAQFFGMTVSELIEDQWNELDMTDAWEDEETEKPVIEDDDGWKDAVRALPPDLLGLLSDFVQEKNLVKPLFFKAFCFWSSNGVVIGIYSIVIWIPSLSHSPSMYA